MDGKVSIIVPVYKVEDRLARCLDSLISQTYENIEIILVDDGSPDKSGIICEEYAAKDKRIKVIHQENRGVSAARNAGLWVAEGDYIGFVDSDDFIEPEMYEKMVKCYQDDRDLIMCGSYTCNNDGMKPQKKLKELQSYEKKCPGEALISVLYEHVTMAVWSKLFKRKNMVSDEGKLHICFNEELSNYEDFIFICEYVNLCKGNFYFLPERLYNYCYQNDSLSRKKKSFREVAYSLSVVVSLQEKYAEEAFRCSELFAVDTIWKYWVVQIFENKSFSKLSDFSEHTDIKNALEKYKGTYYKSSHVPLYKKLIVYLLTKHGKLLFFVAKTARRFG